MSRPITLEEVITYADALIIQYIEKKQASELPQQLASLKIHESERIECLPTLLSKDNKFDTVLENIIHQHLTRAFDDREADVSSSTITIQKGISIPSRKTPQRQLSLPNVLVGTPNTTTPTRRSTGKRPTTVSSEGFKTPKKDNDAFSSPTERRKSCKTSPFIRKRSTLRRDERPQTAPAGVFTRTSSHSSSRSGKHRSKENWIPDHIREKMVQRDLSVAKRNLEFNSMYQNSLSFITAEGQQDGADGVSPFKRNLTKEKFGLATRKQCGLCCRLFLPINLVMAVPLKAVYDMRDTWGGKFDPIGQKSRTVNINPNLKRAPLCYDKTRVCAFCSQLFDNQQNTYRPSFEAKEAEKERASELERERTNAVMSDPLKRVDDERAHEIFDAENASKNGIVCKT